MKTKTIIEVAMPKGARVTGFCYAVDTIGSADHISREDFRILDQAAPLAVDLDIKAVAEFLSGSESPRLQEAGRLASEQVAVEPVAMRHVAYCDEGVLHWRSGIAAFDCELYALPDPSGKKTAGLTTIQPMAVTAPTDLTVYLRQYRHNDNSGFVFGYDKDGIDKLFAPQPAVAVPQGVSDDVLFATPLHWMGGTMTAAEKLAFCAGVKQAKELLATPPEAESAPKVVKRELFSADDLKALKRFAETCADGEGYDVPKETMQKLARIGLVRRCTGNYYETTDFGSSILKPEFYIATPPEAKVQVGDGDPVSGLLPCPFCGNTDISSGEAMGSNFSKQAGCTECGAFGPVAEESGIYSYVNSDSAWNRRTPQPTAATEQHDKDSEVRG